MENEVITEKRISRSELRCQKVREYLANPEDIKYEGPLSYRYLRIIAWIFFVIGQISFVIGISLSFFHWHIISQQGLNILKFLSGLATPLFIISSFGLILSKQKTHKHFLIIYGASFLGLATAIVIIYSRYIFGFYSRYNDPIGLTIVSDNLKNIIDVNVFADLFMLSLFCFFIDYNPKKFFKDKKVIYFRLLAILPALYVAGSYTIKTLNEFDIGNIPIYIFPFLTTKSPLVFMVFICIALWIKSRENTFLKAGATIKDYENYLKTNKNSLAYSIHLAIYILFFVNVEFLLMFIAIIAFAVQPDITFTQALELTSKLQIGQSMPLMAIVPFVLLYSYKRTHKSNTIDIILPAIGIGFTILVYLEWIFQLLTR